MTEFKRFRIKVSFRNDVAKYLNELIEDGFRVVDLGFMTQEMRELADQIDKVIEKERGKK